MLTSRQWSAIEAEYIAMRRLTTAPVSTAKSAGALSIISCSAAIWAAPAIMMAVIAMASTASSPASVASAPKMKPKGATASSTGAAAQAPARKPRRVGMTGSGASTLSMAPGHSRP